MSKNKESKKQQQAPVCVFCGSTPVTEEHLWPQWMEAEFSKFGADKHVVNTEKVLSRDGTRIEQSSKVLNRNIIRKVVKRFCASCNNNWMSSIEDKSKEIIKSLILDQPIILDSDKQNKLAKWGTLKAIVGQYADHETVVPVISKKEELNFL